MRGRLRMTFYPVPSVEAVAAETAKGMLTALTAKSRGQKTMGVMLGNFTGTGEWMVTIDAKESIAADGAERAARLVTVQLNETFDRLRYAMENPDAAVSFAEDGTPRLSACDDSGIDHETLFKIGRVAR